MKITHLGPDTLTTVTLSGTVDNWIPGESRQVDPAAAWGLLLQHPGRFRVEREIEVPRLPLLQARG